MRCELIINKCPHARVDRVQGSRPARFSVYVPQQIQLSFRARTQVLSVSETRDPAKRFEVIALEVGQRIHHPLFGETLCDWLLGMLSEVLQRHEWEFTRL